jgi:hypothetical protein
MVVGVKWKNICSTILFVYISLCLCLWVCSAGIRPTLVGKKLKQTLPKNAVWDFWDILLPCQAKIKVILQIAIWLFHPITQKTNRKLQYVFSEQLILAIVRKVPPSHSLFSKTNCTNATHNVTTHKTKCNNTQDQMQQHTPFSNIGSAFMLMQRQSFVNNFFVIMRAQINVTDKWANRCAKSCWIKLDRQFEKIY